MSTYVEKIADKVEQTSDTQTASPGEPSSTLSSEETAIPLQETTSVSGPGQEDEAKKCRENHTQAIVRMPIAVEQKRTTPPPSPGSYKPSRFCSIFESKYDVTHDHRGRKIFGPASFQFTLPERNSMQTEAESAQKWYEIGGSVKSRTESRIPLGSAWIDCKKLWDKDPPTDAKGFNFKLLTSVSSIGLAKTLPARPATASAPVPAPVPAPVRSSPPGQSQRVSSADETFPHRQDLIAQESDSICDGVRNPNSAFSSSQETPSSLSTNNLVQAAPISHTPSTTWTDAPAPQGPSEARIAGIMNVGPAAATNQPRPPRKRRRLPLFPRNPVFRPVPTLAPVPAQQQRQDDQIVRLYTLDSDGNEGCVVGHWCRYGHRGCRKLLHQTRKMKLVEELK